MPVFTVSPQLFFFVGLAPFACAGAALLALKRMRGMEISVRREILKWCFTLYALLALSLTLFPVRFDPSAVYPRFMPELLNLVPLKTIRQIFDIAVNRHYPMFYRFKAVALNIGGNLLLLMPLGFFLPVRSRRFRQSWVCALSAFFVSCSIELVQFIETSFCLTSSCTTDVDVVILNVAGALIGFLIWRLIIAISIPKKNGRNEI
jgi:glycopeptide antibiotics resistance protein